MTSYVLRQTHILCFCACSIATTPERIISIIVPIFQVCRIIIRFLLINRGRDYVTHEYMLYCAVIKLATKLSQMCTHKPENNNDIGQTNNAINLGWLNGLQGKNLRHKQESIVIQQGSML